MSSWKFTGRSSHKWRERNSEEMGRTAQRIRGLREGWIKQRTEEERGPYRPRREGGEILTESQDLKRRAEVGRWEREDIECSAGSGLVRKPVLYPYERKYLCGGAGSE